MCCSTFSASGSGSICIDGFVRSHFYYGCGGTTVAHPATNHICSRYRSERMSNLPNDEAKLWMRGEQLADAFLETRFVVVEEADLDRGDLALRIDQIRARHAFHRVRARCRARLIEDDRERRRRLLEESLGVGALLVDVDGDDRETATTVFLLHFVHPRKGAPAWP